MSATLWAAPTSNFSSTSLNGAINDSVDTITLNSVSGLPTAGYIVINRQDANGNNTPNAREVVKYTGISGSDLTGCTRAADNSTARSHADGSLVEPVLTVGMWNDQQSFLDVSHASDGTLLPLSTVTITNLTVTSTATIGKVSSLVHEGVKGQFYWSRAGALATVRHAVATDTHFALQRATKNLTINSFYMSVLSAASLAPTQVDITYASGPTTDFTSIFSVKPLIAIGAYTLSSATPGTLSLTSLASGVFLRHEITNPGGAGGIMSQLQVTER